MTWQLVHYEGERRVGPVRGYASYPSAEAAQRQADISNRSYSINQRLKKQVNDLRLWHVKVEEIKDDAVAS